MTSSRHSSASVIRGLVASARASAGARLAGQQRLGVVQLADGGQLAGRLDEAADGLDLGSHGPGREVAGPEFGGRGPADRVRLRGAVPVLGCGHVGEQQEHVGVELAGSRAAVRSLSTTASTPRVCPVPFTAMTGTPPPPEQTTIVCRSSSIWMIGGSSSSAGSGEGGQAVHELDRRVPGGRDQKSLIIWAEGHRASLRPGLTGIIRSLPRVSAGLPPHGWPMPYGSPGK